MNRRYISSASVISKEGKTRIIMTETACDKDGYPLEEPKVVLKRNFPKWDMALVKIPDRPSELTPEQEAKCKEVIKTKLGAEVLNALKNRRANSIVNSYLEIEKSRLKGIPYNKRGAHFPITMNLLNSILQTELNAEANVKNMISHKSLGISLHQIFNEFKRVGLIK